MVRAPVRAGSPGTRVYVYSNEPINCFNCRRKGPAGRKLNARSAKFDYPPASASSALSCNSIWKVQISDWENANARTPCETLIWSVPKKTATTRSEENVSQFLFLLLAGWIGSGAFVCGGRERWIEICGLAGPLWPGESQGANSMGK